MNEVTLPVEMLTRLVDVLERLDARMAADAAPAAAADGLLTIDEVASQLRQSRRQVERLVKQGKLPKIKLGHRSVKYRPADVERLLSTKSTAEKPGRRRL